MRLAWHIARKDLRRLSVVLVLWAAVLTGQMALATIQSNLDAVGYFPFYVAAWVFGRVFLPFLGIGLVMGAQHDDSVCDSDSFWITRPISGIQLLSAKAMVLVLLGIFPALVLAPWWLAQHYTLPQFASAVAWTTRCQFAVTLLVIPLAALAASNGRFVINLFALAITFLVLSIAYGRIAADRVFSPSPLTGQAWGAAVAIAWFIGGAIAVVHQYLTRRTGRSAAIVVLTTIIGLAVSFRLEAPPVRESAAVAAETTRVPVMEILRPQAGSASLAAGLRIRVIESIPDFVRGWLVTISESSPDFTSPGWIRVAPPVAPAVGHEYYFLVNAHDGRSALATVGIVGESLTAETIHFIRRELAFAPRREWTTDPAFDFPTWVKGALLVKVTSPTELTDFPRELLPAVTPRA